MENQNPLEELSLESDGLWSELILLHLLLDQTRALGFLQQSTLQKVVRGRQVD
jgi:hypothetical protein